MISVRNGLLESCIVAALLMVFGAQILLSVRHLSQTYDESVHIWAGYQSLRARDFGLNPEHPPLVKAVAALPLLGLDLKLPTPITGATKPAAFDSGIQFLYRNNADAILFWSRLAVSSFSFLLAILVFLCAKEMFGAGAGLLGMTILVFEPTILAHGGLVTTDIAETCFLFGSVYAFYRFVRQPNIGRLLICGGTVALALTAKHSGLVVLPILMLLAAVELLQRRKSSPQVHEFWKMQSDMGHAARLAAAIAVICVVGYGGLWASYSFRYAARPGNLTLTPAVDAAARARPGSIESNALLLVSRAHLLPESYLWGLVDIFQVTAGRSAFLLGKVYANGQSVYFPTAFILKSTVAFLVILVLIPITQLPFNRGIRREILFLLIPTVVYAIVTINSGLNIGIRHILPIFPFLIVLGAAAGHAFAARNRFTAGAILILVLMHASSSLNAYPNYLTYTNELAGGSSNTYRLLDDSNVDWGQGLKQMGAYIQEHRISDCWFAYTIHLIDPAYYGIPCKLLPTGPVGWTSIIPRSITGPVFIGAFTASGRNWGPYELNPYIEFFNRTPDDIIGNSILVFNGSFEVPLAAAVTHANRAQQLLRQKLSDQALAEAQTAAALAPNSADMRARLCQVMEALEKNSEAEEVCASALELARRTYPDYQFLRIASVREIAQSR